MTTRMRPVFPAPAQSWLELFFDLAFVAAIVVVSASYSRDYSAGQAAWLMLVFALIWTTWLMTTLRLQGSEISGVLPRVLIVVQMALVLLMAITADEFLQDVTDEVSEPVGFFFGLVLATGMLLNRAVTTPGDPARMTRSETWRLVAAIAVFMMTRFVTSPQYSVVLWIGALLLVLSTLRRNVVWNAEVAHRVTHRFGEFTIIVLGESFLKLALVAGEEPMEDLDLYALPLVFAVITAIWWIYFAYVSPAGMATRQRTWMLMHLPLHLFTIALAVGLSKLLLPENETYQGSGYGLIAVPLVAVLLCLAVLLRIGRGPFARRGPWVLIGGCVAVVGVVLLNYAGRGLEFDLAGTALLLSIVLLATIRGLGPMRVPADDPDPSTEATAEVLT
ncbi:MAG: low temperature requirement protein A [Candidatus Nanopelagicales bacterium]